MADNWAQTQREGWLCRLYGKDDGSGTQKLSNESVQWQLVGVLEALLSDKSSPKDAAAKTASLIISQEEISTPWSNLMGIYFDATVNFEGEKELEVLANYIVELASLPDAVNNRSQAILCKIEGMNTLRTEPGETIVLENGRLWRDLPKFGWNLTERFQGPELYLFGNAAASPEASKTAWRNINTWLALLAINPDAKKIPRLAGKVDLGLRALAMALEYSPDMRFGKHSELHTPAAAQWLRIAGDEMERLCKDGTKRETPGDLWVAKGGGELCDSTRLQFWRTRISDLGL